MRGAGVPCGTKYLNWVPIHLPWRVAGDIGRSSAVRSRLVFAFCAIPLTLPAMPRLKAPQRREQLIDVATKLFARNGYEATTTAAIALAAGGTEPILYRHFKSKQELFVAIVRAVSEQTMTHWQELIAGVEDPAERIRRIAKEFPQHTKHLDDAYHVL